MHHGRSIAAAVAFALGLVGFAACGMRDPHDFDVSSGGVPPPGSAPGGGPCDDGDTRPCFVTLGMHEATLSCYEGTQTCVGGAWGVCGDGEVVERAAPSWLATQDDEPGASGGSNGANAASLASSSPSAATASAASANDARPRPPDEPRVAKPLGLSQAAPCADNPCDPTCQKFVEKPDGGITPDPTGTLFEWESGDLGALSSAVLAEAMNEPCSQALDCQFDSRCDNPTEGTCSHHPCVAGQGLEPGCSSCVDAVCAADPSCCNMPYEGPCAHDFCGPGGPLDGACDPCVQAVCAADPYCCSTAWDSTCVGEVGSICGQVCPSPGTWTQACVNLVHDVCGAFCAVDPPCAHDKCYEGGALAPGCDPCVDAICQADPYCCAPSGAWDAYCVGAVQTLCKEACPKVGTCVPWVPGETDPMCTGVDLTVGVPCAGKVPVCNRGTQPAPAGVRLVHFPADSQQIATCYPDQGHPDAIGCFTSEPIPPGFCIEVDDCPGLESGREIMVNPPDPEAVVECTCQNNWAIDDEGACSPPSCSGVSSESTIRKVNLFITVDRSGSMALNGWTECMNAIKAFVKDPGSAGLGVALRFWADNAPASGCDGTTCSVDACAQPLVPLGTLTAQPAPMDPHEAALVTAINGKSPSGGTPMYPALAGAEKWAKAYRAAHPEEQAVVVLITDGEPTQCNTSIAAIAGLAADAFLNHGVRTYVIGIEAASFQSTLHTIAQAGGTNQAFLVPKGGGGTTNTALLNALQTIKGSAVSCDFPLPKAGLYDPKKATVRYVPSSGGPVTLAQVGGAGQCGSGWYYDDSAAPSAITLCPATCDAAKADPNARIEVSLACPGTYDPVVLHEIYQSDCPPGTKVQWGYLAYSTFTPADSSVVFEAHATDGTSAWPAPVVVATAHQSGGTEECSMAGPAPCPIDLYEALGTPMARRDKLQLHITLNPSSSTLIPPTLKDWQVTYSCPDGE